MISCALMSMSMKRDRAKLATEACTLIRTYAIWAIMSTEFVRAQFPQRAEQDEYDKI